MWCWPMRWLRRCALRRRLQRRNRRMRSNGAAASATYGVDLFGRARGEQLTVTLTSNRVLAILGQMDRQALAMGIGMIPSVRLACLDRSNGKPVWTRSPADLPETVAPLR